MLPLYLQKTNVVTGPLARNTSYSRLDVLRRNLLGLPLFKGGEAFLLFGAALHEVFLENKYDSYNKLDQVLRAKIDRMVTKLKRHPIVSALVKDATNEHKKYGFINGVQLAYILDNKQAKHKRGADLKTTVCKTQKEFEEKAIEYGYIKQGHVYKKIENLKSFYFYGICKEPPHNIFILDLNRFKSEELYASKEIEWLLYMYANYGNFKTVETYETTKEMAQKGKEYLANIQSKLKDHLLLKKAETKAAKEVAKSAKQLNALIKKFPKEERKLFNEKIEAILKKI